jgi:hypothetical protein
MKWNYRYIEGIETREVAVPLELGKLLHQYFAQYYQGLKDGAAAQASHDAAYTQVMDEWGPKITDLATLSYSLDRDDTAEWLLGLAEQVRTLISRYYVVRGAQDAVDYDILHVEVPLRVRLFDDMESYGIADLVLRERRTGLLYMAEHKTTKNIPSSNFRLRDLQTVLYTEKLRLLTGLNMDGVLWSYTRTEKPKEPRLLKDGTFSRAQIDSTWHVYKAAVEVVGQNPLDYEDMHERLESREVEDYFPRFSYFLKTDRGILIRDYIETARAIEKAKQDWAAGTRTPVRNLTRNCDWCSFAKLCTGAIVAGGTADILKTYYTTREQRKSTIELVPELP